ncbi:MAG: EamA family transporter, partial [Nitrospinota bacterium]
MSALWMAQIFSLLTALGFATGDSAARFAIRTSTPVTVILTLSLTTLVMYGPAAWVSVQAGGINIPGVLIFLAAGAASPGLAGMFHYMSFRRIGLSRSVSIAASSPLITVVIAVAALDERPSSL